MSILEERLPYIESLKLDRGSHAAPSNGLVNACVMEAVAYVAGEPWSDRPQCASPVLTSFLIGLNDRWSEDDRQLLKPFIVRLVGTNTGLADEETRRYMIRDWLAREYAPAVFRRVGLIGEAEAFEGLAEISSVKSWAAARTTIYKVRDEQWERRKAAWKRLRAVAAAVAAAAAYAVADAVAAAVAYAVADADAAAVADAAADAVADAVAAADAAAVADTAAYAVADADAAAVADAAAAAYAAAAFEAKVQEATEAANAAAANYWDRRNAAYRVFKPYYDERYSGMFGEVGGLRESVLGLVDRLIEVGKA